MQENFYLAGPIRCAVVSSSTPHCASIPRQSLRHSVAQRRAGAVLAAGTKQRRESLLTLEEVWNEPEQCALVRDGAISMFTEQQLEWKFRSRNGIVIDREIAANASAQIDSDHLTTTGRRDKSDIACQLSNGLEESAVPEQPDFTQHKETEQCDHFARLESSGSEEVIGGSILHAAALTVSSQLEADLVSEPSNRTSPQAVPSTICISTDVQSNATENRPLAISTQHKELSHEASNSYGRAVSVTCIDDVDAETASCPDKKTIKSGASINDDPDANGIHVQPHASAHGPGQSDIEFSLTSIASIDLLMTDNDSEGVDRVSSNTTRFTEVPSSNDKEPRRAQRFRLEKQRHALSTPIPRKQGLQVYKAF